MDVLLIVNAGSASLKFQVFETDGKSSLKRLIKGQMEGIGTAPRLRAKGVDASSLIDQKYAVDVVANVADAIRVTGAWLRATQNVNLVAVGHRVVHGGPKYHRPILIDMETINVLERYIPLAPLHQPNNLATIRTLLKDFPELPQVACFDTAFHRNHTEVADRFAIPDYFYQEGVRRYGFHGLSYEYVSRAFREMFPDGGKPRVIIAHLGSGASMCALSNGRSVESTMGFTALDGLPMGTRPGQIDPGVLLYLILEKGMTAASVQKFLYGECGLKGLSGISNDMRDLESRNDPGAILAVEYFVYRVGLHAGMLAAALGGIDAFIFTAGIGENSASVRARIAAKLKWLGAQLDPEANAGGQSVISRADSRVLLCVIPTDEELMIAEHTLTTIVESDKLRIARSL